MIFTKLIEQVIMGFACRNDSSAFLNFSCFLCRCQKTWFSWNFHVSCYYLSIEKSLNGQSSNVCAKDIVPSFLESVR